MATVNAPSDEQLDAAIAAAAEAQRDWERTPAVERGEMLHEVATRLRARTDELAELMTLEGGKPLIENSDEIGWTAAAFDYYAEIGRDSAGRVIPSIESSQLAMVVKDPIGPVGCIVPWNYPLLLLAWKLAPALAAGNTTVSKPSELTPLSTLAAASCFDHLPAGVVNVVAGAGDVGAAIVADERIECVAFTGLGRDREADRRRLRRARRPRQPRDGRQGPLHRLRRRRRQDRRRRPRRRLGRVPQRRPGLHLGGALLHPRRRLRRLPAGVHRPHALAADRRPDRPRDRRRPDGLRDAARQGRRPGRGRGRGRRRAGRRRRRGRPRPRPLLRPRGGHRRRRRHRAALRGDLRPGGAAGARALARRGDRATRTRPASGSAPTSTPRTCGPCCAACASSRPGRCGSTTR